MPASLRFVKLANAELDAGGASSYPQRSRPFLRLVHDAPPDAARTDLPVGNVQRYLEDLVGRAWGHVERGRQFRSAIGLCDEAIRLDPNNAAAHAVRGMAFIGIGGDREADRSFDRAIALSPKDSRFHEWRGFILAEAGRYDEAVRSYDRAIELSPEQARLHSARGFTLAEDRRFEQAIQSFDRAIDLSPENAQFHVLRGLALAEIHRYEEAIQSFGRAIDLDPREAMAYGSHGDILGEVGRYKEAIQSLDRAIVLNPHSGIYRADRASCLARLGQYRDAIAGYSESLNLAHTQNNRYILYYIAEEMKWLINDLVKRGKITYGSDPYAVTTMDARADDLNAVAADLGLSFEAGRKALEREASETSRGDIAHATAAKSAREDLDRTPTRPRWETRRGDDLELTPEEFVAKHYASEKAAVTPRPVWQPERALR